MNHSAIIINAGDISAVSKILALPYERVAAWKRLDNIPGKYWAALSEHKIASLEELAEHARTRDTEAAQ